MQYTLQILAKDIETSNYTNSEDCAITRAIKRAGFDGNDSGFHTIINGEVFKNGNSNRKGLNDKVKSMYGFIDEKRGRSTSDWAVEEFIQPADFEFTLKMNGNGVQNENNPKKEVL